MVYNSNLFAFLKYSSKNSKFFTTAYFLLRQVLEYLFKILSNNFYQPIKLLSIRTGKVVTNGAESPVVKAGAPSVGVVAIIGITDAVGCGKVVVITGGGLIV